MDRRSDQTLTQVAVSACMCPRARRLPDVANSPIFSFSSLALRLRARILSYNTISAPKKGRRAWPRHQKKSCPSIRQPTAGGWPSPSSPRPAPRRRWATRRPAGSSQRRPEPPRAPQGAARARSRPEVRPPGHSSPRAGSDRRRREREGEGEEGEKGRPDAEARRPPP